MFGFNFMQVPGAVAESEDVGMEDDANEMEEEEVDLEKDEGEEVNKDQEEDQDEEEEKALSSGRSIPTRALLSPQVSYINMGTMEIAASEMAPLHASDMRASPSISIEMSLDEELDDEDLQDVASESEADWPHQQGATHFKMWF